ncbi:CAIB/BAIF family protein [hydrothermal vent metagenome]|uniref:CAIB/BAIF family protein n=1 Tax=hydrothermal vent metagenome TaxID=652676 RepID=A0A3B0S6S4_9ZZZZ
MSDSSKESSTGPLAGVRVLDLSRILAGPTCTQLLGDLGADVIKIERPGIGDDTRNWGPPFIKDQDGNDTSESAYYQCANRNKRSVAIDMARPEGAALIRELAGTCDILIENFKVGNLKKYGLDYHSMKEQFPDLVYCSITGFGQTGPNAHKAGYDLMAQGYGGIMSLTGEPEGEPMKVAVGIADVVCGLYASTAILAALRHRDLGHGGQQIDLALVDTQVAWLINAGTHYLTSGKAPARQGNQHANIVPYQVFEAADGHVIVATGNDGQYARVCQLIERPDLATDERFANNAARLENREMLIAILADVIKDWKKDDLLRGLDELGVPAGPVNTLPEVFATDQVAARDMKITMEHPVAGSGHVDLIGNPLKLNQTPIDYRRPPPMLGQHTAEVVEELLGSDAVHKAKANKTIE